MGSTSPSGDVTRETPATSASTQSTANAPSTTGLASAMSTLSLAIKKPFLSATTLLSDSSLRKKSAAMISQQTNARIISPLRAGLTTLFDGPRQVQSTLTRLQKEYSQKRMEVLLEKHRDENQDVQVGFNLFEDAPQELRARLWMAVLGDARGDLVASYDDARRHDAGGGHGGGEVVGSDRHGVAAPGSSPTARGRIQDVYAEMRDQSTIVPWTTEKDNYRNTMMKSMVEVQWPLVPGVEGGDVREGGADEKRREEEQGDAPSITTSDPNSSSLESPVNHGGICQHDYRTLLQISVGQEDVDDVIARDIHRTFPEHPLFGFAQGQQSLFNLLKAYSLHDLEVGYCQGMAFVAGLLLFYVPEESAFAIFCRLMDADGPSGPPEQLEMPGGDGARDAHDVAAATKGRPGRSNAVNVGLRSLYLPGLLGLKHMLGTFDELMQEYMPELKAHLEEHGVASVLYCTQWFLSLYACPFPVHFSARLIDVMLLQGDRGILLRTAMAIMCECENELLELDAFEPLLVHLKVDPLSWSTTRLRRVLNAALNSPISDAVLDEYGALAESRTEPCDTGDGLAEASADATTTGQQEEEEESCPHLCEDTEVVQAVQVVPAGPLAV